MSDQATLTVLTEELGQALERLVAAQAEDFDDQIVSDSVRDAVTAVTTAGDRVAVLKRRLNFVGVLKP